MEATSKGIRVEIRLDSVMHSRTFLRQRIELAGHQNPWNDLVFPLAVVNDIWNLEVSANLVLWDDEDYMISTLCICFDHARVINPRGFHVIFPPCRIIYNSQIESFVALP